MIRSDEAPTPVVIRCQPAKPILRITPPSPFPYPSDKKVPWVYEPRVSEPEGGVLGITRSGLCFKGPEPRGKEPLQPPRERVTDEEAASFLKAIKTSEYKVVDQMGKVPAQISLLSLLTSSEKHREALLKVLKEAQVPEKISASQVEEMVGSVFYQQIAFSEEELGPEEYGHVKALHIACKCKGFVIARVLIDNGSALNVCPLSTVDQLGIGRESINESKTAVRAFDGTRKNVVGEIELPLDIGPVTFNITFQVLDIPNAFSLLLGRPWIHAAGAIPSSLHQKVKFIADGKVVTVNGEEDYAIYKETAIPYIDAHEEEVPSYHSFEVVSAIRAQQPSPADLMVAKVLMKNRYTPGMGLGRYGQGVPRPLRLKENRFRLGLGYRQGAPSSTPKVRGVAPLETYFPGPPRIEGGDFAGLAQLFEEKAQLEGCP